MVPISSDTLRKLAETLLQAALEVDEGVPPAPVPVGSSVLLDVPYHSQHEADATRFRKDCGPACVEMIGKYYNPSIDAGTDDIMLYITNYDRGVYVRELQAACAHFFDVDLDRRDESEWEDLKRWLGAGKPVIALVHYGSFAMRIDRQYTGGHFLVVVGHDQIEYQGRTVERAIIHDPDFYRQLKPQGAFIPVIKEHFMGMWEDCHMDNNPRRLALVPKGSA